MNIEAIKHYYLAGNTIQQTADNFKISYPTTQRIISNAGITRSIRKYHFNEEFFEIINSEEKAYFLGLLYADGSLNKRNNSIELTLHHRDEDIILKFRDAINLDKPLKDKQPTNYNSSLQKNLYISSAKMLKCLSAKGCTPNKTDTLRFPTKEQVPIELLKHFVRGFFDGDGSVTVNKIARTMNFVGNHQFIEGLQQYIHETLNIPITKLLPHNKTYILVYNGGNNVYKILDFLYTNATVYLERKYQKYQLLCQVKINKKKYREILN